MNPYEVERRRHKEMAASVALRAAALLEMSPTRYQLARTADGKECDPTSDHAQSFCSIGAIERARFEIGNGKAELMVFERLIRLVPDFVRVNDEERGGIPRIAKALRAVARDLENGL